MNNSFGQFFRITTYGESHGVALGVVIDGCPAGVVVTPSDIQYELDRRKPGQSKIVTQRKESDTFEILSGVFEGKTTGTPISIIIRNENQKSKDYDHLKEVFRPSHADFTYTEKYGFRDYRGGGRSSARETAARVAAGAVAKHFLKQVSAMEVYSYVNSVGNIQVEKNYSELEPSAIESNEVRCPDAKVASKMINLIKKTKKEGDTIGGTIVGVIKNVPIGLGEPVFDKLHAVLGQAMLSIPAVKGVEFGSGFEGTAMRGSAHNDILLPHKKTQTNYSGGIQGGISNGEDIYFKIAFKPVATIMRDQKTIDIHGEEKIVSGKGRHDACVLPRAVAIVDAMSNLVMADFWLRNKISNLEGLKNL